ncbi:putative Late nodulin [Medicago truncatula]|uniref:Nodule Cysteine-Rich (NCR) secreted peptide n=1 Tax=Medicago truncatula TaxID=3880 RepID=A0A072VAA4_MEDTR|nr:Nodule Cysteine-Rich (NCR) secreted peptide [Medicago truncatula]RHN75416.1 putative Late nodulin [Medicago truncatula]
MAEILKIIYALIILHLLFLTMVVTGESFHPCKINEHCTTYKCLLTGQPWCFMDFCLCMYFN